ncbi:hypothetical protein HELRODRAFT_177172 [Helobdella robusta]|uniref:Uncharacterized protein n=1 Tax=Helobdella robusta TaxID=6412 RepID=T1FBB3_HELRO|nr:hypothetical protein HELRODRAFT_177172 [Helobdella robusta]ESN98290.1 hypothetical protein HELRODRAFT_177172 [Helobdella robusta]
MRNGLRGEGSGERTANKWHQTNVDGRCLLDNPLNEQNASSTYITSDYDNHKYYVTKMIFLCNLHLVNECNNLCVQMLKASTDHTGSIMVTTKKRQDLRIQLQKRARRRAEKKVEYLEDDRNWKEHSIFTIPRLVQSKCNIFLISEKIILIQIVSPDRSLLKKNKRK